MKKIIIMLIIFSSIIQAAIEKSVIVERIEVVEKHIQVIVSPEFDYAYYHELKVITIRPDLLKGHIYHEFGHALDDYMNQEGKYASYETITPILDEYRKKENELFREYVIRTTLKEAFEMEASPFIQDIFSAISYDSLVTIYGHSEEYWRRGDQERATEVFANITALILLDAERELEYLYEFMPELMEAYERMFDE